ncbi:unnamed protein product [Linum tenue]|uniref:Uncharacterized protein n=1 Tax=Linum tenue TaxID=586396 RepID=A0AAV0L8F7_9ROSI|nr:unnamed protein product [Linum tenue]
MKTNARQIQLRDFAKSQISLNRKSDGAKETPAGEVKKVEGKTAGERERGTPTGDGDYFRRDSLHQFLTEPLLGASFGAVICSASTPNPLQNSGVGLSNSGVPLFWLA